MPMIRGISSTTTAMGLVRLITSSAGAPIAMAVTLLSARPMLHHRSGARRNCAIQTNTAV
ncbi:hypothetical protein C1880_05535 [Senegalimassilia anaerobia]|uniref:Uncharacterized protein n=1 Tax=Senegalimassilia anaerobia TaxID=1473216 RepID=A0A369L9D9_9ACTN|nr:hypothetical protein C1880_05535 [Senegalimassilia anaerobia]